MYGGRRLHVVADRMIYFTGSHRQLGQQPTIWGIHRCNQRLRGGDHPQRAPNQMAQEIGHQLTIVR
jgi:hypothetical protein